MRMLVVVWLWSPLITTAALQLCCGPGTPYTASYSQQMPSVSMIAQANGLILPASRVSTKPIRISSFRVKQLLLSSVGSNLCQVAGRRGEVEVVGRDLHKLSARNP